MGTCELFSEDFFSWIFLHSITSVLDWKFLSFYGGCSVSNFWQPKQLVICAVWMRCTWPFALRYAQNLFQIPIKSEYHLWTRNHLICSPLLEYIFYNIYLRHTNISTSSQNNFAPSTLGPSRSFYSLLLCIFKLATLPRTHWLTPSPYLWFVANLTLSEIHYPRFRPSSHEETEGTSRSLKVRCATK